MALVPIHDQRVLKLCFLLYENISEKNKFAVWTEAVCMFGIETEDDVRTAVRYETRPVIWVPHDKIQDDMDAICFPKGMFVAHGSCELADVSQFGRCCEGIEATT